MNCIHFIMEFDTRKEEPSRFSYCYIENASIRRC